MWASRSEGEVGAGVGHFELEEGRRRRGGRKAWRRGFQMLSRSVERVRQIWATVVRGCLPLKVGLCWTELWAAKVFEIAVCPFLFPKEMLTWWSRGHLPVSTSLMD